MLFFFLNLLYTLCVVGLGPCAFSMMCHYFSIIKKKLRLFLLPHPFPARRAITENSTNHLDEDSREKGKEEKHAHSRNELLLNLDLLPLWKWHGRWICCFGTHWACKQCKRKFHIILGACMEGIIWWDTKMTLCCNAPLHALHSAYVVLRYLLKMLIYIYLTSFPRL